MFQQMQSCLAGRKWQSWLRTRSLCYIFINLSFQTNPLKSVYECENHQTTMLLLLSSNLSLFVIGFRRYYDSYTRSTKDSFLLLLLRSAAFHDQSIQRYCIVQNCNTYDNRYSRIFSSDQFQNC